MFFVVNVRLVPDFFLHLLELLDVVWIVHRVMFLEIVECGSAGVIFSASPGDYFWRLQGPASLIQALGIDIYHVFEGFNLMRLWKFCGFQLLLGLIHLVGGLLDHNWKEWRFRMLFDHIVDFVSFGLKHVFESVLDIEWFVGLLAHLNNGAVIEPLEPLLIPLLFFLTG